MAAKSRTLASVTASLAVIVHVIAASAATPEAKCVAARYKAAAKYAACFQRLQAKYALTADISRAFPMLIRCRLRYVRSWPRLNALFPTTSCAASRFVDNESTVRDNLTGLVWEKKDMTCPGTHCVATYYRWSTDDTSADGEVFTEFLSSINAQCFAGQCDWRLPTNAELLTLVDPFPCHTGYPTPCIDPIFGPTIGEGYWASSSGAGGPFGGWGVLFVGGSIFVASPSGNEYARAVRGGF